MNRNENLLKNLRASKQSDPCVSIYFNKPNSRLSARVPTIKFYQELSYARKLLETSMSRKKAADYLKPAWLAAKDELLDESESSLAIFQSGDTVSCVRLSEKVPERTVVATDFHIKPLVKTLSPPNQDELAVAVAQCQRAVLQGEATSDLFQIAQALKFGAIKRLWVAEDESIWGVLNRKLGTIVIHPQQLNAQDGDLLDDLAEWAIDKGLPVFVLPLRLIPGQQPIVAQFKKTSSL